MTISHRRTGDTKNVVSPEVLAAGRTGLDTRTPDERSAASSIFFDDAASRKTARTTTKFQVRVMLSENTLERAGRRVAAPRERGEKKGSRLEERSERFLCEEGGRDESPPARGDEKKKSRRANLRIRGREPRSERRAPTPSAAARRAGACVRVVSFVP